MPPEPLTRGLLSPDPLSLCPLSSTEFVEPLPPNKTPGYATASLYIYEINITSVSHNSAAGFVRMIQGILGAILMPKRLKGERECVPPNLNFSNQLTDNYETWYERSSRGEGVPKSGGPVAHATDIARCRLTFSVLSLTNASRLICTEQRTVRLICTEQRTVRLICTEQRTD